jgi:hypothetical protein
MSRRPGGLKTNPALAAILRRANIDDVVSSAELEGDVGGNDDVAVVTGTVPDGVTSNVTIHLPRNDSGTGDIIVRDHSGSRTAPLVRLQQLFEALDRVLPGPQSRADLV